MIFEYLDRGSLVARMKYYKEHTTEESGEHYAYTVALREIRNAPAADVAPVVHCKDCKYYRVSTMLAPNKFCFRLKHPVEDRPIGYNFAPDDFCSYGERKEND